MSHFTLRALCRLLQFILWSILGFLPPRTKSFLMSHIRILFPAGCGIIACVLFPAVNCLSDCDTDCDDDCNVKCLASSLLLHLQFDSIFNSQDLSLRIVHAILIGYLQFFFWVCCYFYYIYLSISHKIGVRLSREKHDVYALYHSRS